MTDLRDYLATWAGEDPTCRAVAAVVEAIGRGAVEFAELVGLGALAAGMEAVVSTDAEGGAQKAVDLHAHDIFHAVLRDAPIAAIASEEADEPVPVHAGAPLAVTIDPLDGSKNTDVNAAVGSIFAILPMIEGNAIATFMQPGTAQLAAGFTVHGPQTTLVLTLGLGADIFTLDRRRGVFVLTGEKVRLPDGNREFAIDTSNYRHWDLPIRTYIDDCVAGADGPRGSDFNMRWVACAVAEAYRILLRGGIYLYPRDERAAYRQGRMRLIYEANPIAFVIEQAGGAATDGIARILDRVPEQLHQRVPFIFGAREKVERVARYSSGQLPLGERSPLFARRGLFRV